MGFDIEEEEIFEEPCSLKEYLSQPIRLSGITFKRIAFKPKLTHWFIVLLLSSAFVMLSSYLAVQKINFQIVAGPQLPEEAVQAAGELMESIAKNPAIIFLGVFVSSLVIQIIISLIYYLLIRASGRKAGFLSSLLIIGLTNIPTIVSGILQSYLALNMPEVTVILNLSEQKGLLGGPSVGNMGISMDSTVIGMILSVWSLIILYSACRSGFNLSKGRAVLSSVIAWLIMLLPSIYSLLMIL